MNLVVLIVDLWHLASAIEAPETRQRVVKCLSLAICNLTDGRVNTARMVNDGATHLLVALCLSDELTSDGYVCKRGSSALCNLLHVLTNHQTMVSQNVIPALVKLAQMPDHAVRQNCASALRRLTFNKRSRDLIVESGAISGGNGLAQACTHTRLNKLMHASGSGTLVMHTSGAWTSTYTYESHKTTSTSCPHYCSNFGRDQQRGLTSR